MALPDNLRTSMEEISHDCEEKASQTEGGAQMIEKHNQEDDSVEKSEQSASCEEPDYAALTEIRDQLSSVLRQLMTLGSNESVLKEVLAALLQIESRLSACEASAASFVGERVCALESSLAAIADKQDRNDRQLAQDLRENANFKIQVRQGMQHDLDTLKSQLSGEQFNSILKEIAMIYSEYQTILDEDLPLRAKKNISSLFEQLEDLFSDYDAEVVQSKIGAVRQARICKIVSKIPTSNEEQHNTIACSRKPGVIRGRTVLYPEYVDVYVFDSEMTATHTGDEGIKSMESIRTNPLSDDEQIGNTQPDDSGPLLVQETVS